MIFWLRVLVTLTAALSGVPLGVGIALLLAAAAAFWRGDGGAPLAGAALSLVAAAFGSGLLYLDRWLSWLPVRGKRGFDVGVAVTSKPDAHVRGDHVVRSDSKWRRRLPPTLVCVVAVTVASVTTPAAWWYVGFSKNLRLAEAHAPVVRRVLEADGRFTEVEVYEFTFRGGCLAVHAVAREGAAQDIKRLVESTSPPVAVHYDVYELRGGSARRPVQVELNP
jgi:hypothetical protein